MDKIDEILIRRVSNIIPDKKSLEKTLGNGSKLNIYLGIDPTATRLHLGNSVPLRKLQEFVELGHNVTFLIGDFTALIGDTSDKDVERPLLTAGEIEQNFKTYKKQAEKLVDFSKVKVRHNSQWLKKLTFKDIVSLAQHFSVGDFVGRELIRDRLLQGKRVRLDETLYPVMQGYDSYFMNTDIQIGGADQTFNMQAGRVLQKDLRNKESFVCVTGYLEGTDGRKMSKSWGNAIWLGDEPKEMFGKVMSIEDRLIMPYFELATNASSARIEEEKKAFKGGENPSRIKARLAFEIVRELHSEKDAKSAQEYFEKTFQKGSPEYDRELTLKENLLDTLVQVGKSKSEVKRLLTQGAIDVNGKTITDPDHQLGVGDKVKIGERIFVKIGS